MSKSNFIETETHTCNQVRYKVITEPLLEKAMDELLDGNNPCDVKKMVIQPRNKTEEHVVCPSGIIEDENIPWVQNKSLVEHRRIII